MLKQRVRGHCLSHTRCLSGIWKDTTHTARAGSTTRKNKTPFIVHKTLCLTGGWEAKNKTWLQVVKSSCTQRLKRNKLKLLPHSLGRGLEITAPGWGGFHMDVRLCQSSQLRILRAGSDEEKWHFNALRARVTRPGGLHTNVLSHSNTQTVLELQDPGNTCH